MIGDIKEKTFNTLLVLVQSIREIFRCSAKYATLLLISIVLKGSSPAIRIYIVKIIIDNLAIHQEDFAAVIPLIVLWGLVYFVDYVSTTVFSFSMGMLNDTLVGHVNTAIMHKANSLAGMEYFDDKKFHDTAHNLLHYSGTRPINLIVNLSNTIAYSISVISILIVLATITIWIPIMILLAALPHTVLTIKLQKFSWITVTKNSFEARRTQYLSRLSLDAQAVHEVKLFNSGRFLLKKYCEGYQRMIANMFRVRKKQLLLSLPTIVISLASTVFAFTFIIIGTSRGSISIGSLSAFIQSLILFQSSLFELVQLLGYLSGILLYFSDYFSFLKIKPTILPGTIDCIDTNECTIEFRNVSFWYPNGTKALHDVSFAIHSNEKLAIVGENGSGKTTIVKLLLRFYDPQQGQILFNNTDIRSFTVESWRRIISAVFQDYTKYALSVGENISISDYEKEFKQEDRYIEYLGIKNILKRNNANFDSMLKREFGGIEFSGGAWQRLALARALHRKASLMILDEPTASLDPQTEAQIFKDFAYVTAGKTTILITHRLGSITMSDAVLVLKNGKKVEYGSHDALMKNNSFYKAMYTAQADQYK